MFDSSEEHSVIVSRNVGTFALSLHVLQGVHVNLLVRLLQKCLSQTEQSALSTFQIAVDEQLLRRGRRRRRRFQILCVQGLHPVLGAVGARGDVGDPEGTPEHDGCADHARQEHGDHP